MKEIISDRDESNLIDRIIEIRKKYPKVIVGVIARPVKIGGVSDGVFEAEVEY